MGEFDVEMTDGFGLDDYSRWVNCGPEWVNFCASLICNFGLVRIVWAGLRSVWLRVKVLKGLTQVYQNERLTRKEKKKWRK